MKHAIIASTLAALLVMPAAPVQAATARPGQFCAKAKIGKVVKTPSAKLKCVRDGGRARWKRV